MEEKKQELKNRKSSKALIEYSQTFDDAYENLGDYNPTQKIKGLIVFDHMIADIEANKKIKSYSY